MGRKCAWAGKAHSLSARREPRLGSSTLNRPLRSILFIPSGGSQHTQKVFSLDSGGPSRGGKNPKLATGSEAGLSWGHSLSLWGLCIQKETNRMGLAHGHQAGGYFGAASL